uniref:Uncharacterized protein n=1 Tax=Anguilla anguilla TaxID=7936 RepID=A0A0E9RG44_ANGAN
MIPGYTGCVPFVLRRGFMLGDFTQRFLFLSANCTYLPISLWIYSPSSTV